VFDRFCGNFGGVNVMDSEELRDLTGAAAIHEAADWLAAEPATDWGDHEWRLFNAVEAAEALLAELDAARAEVERLREALAECRDEIDGYIHAEYPGEHPAQVRRRNRDLASNPARAAIETWPAIPPAPPSARKG
jgi:hypothetical protein